MEWYRNEPEREPERSTPGFSQREIGRAPTETAALAILGEGIHDRAGIATSSGHLAPSLQTTLVDVFSRSVPDRVALVSA